MANKRVGKRTVKLQNNPTIISAASVVGPKEGQGPLKEYFNLILQDDLYGEKSWELAESKMVQTAMHMAAQKAGKKLEDINYLIGGDLINQIVPSSFAARELGIPFFGIYLSLIHILSFLYYLLYLEVIRVLSKLVYFFHLNV